jgi:effector-binding domain-containing protein
MIMPVVQEGSRSQINERKRKVSTQPIVHKEIEAMQVAGVKAVVEKRADIFPLFEPLRQVCGDAICGPTMAIFHSGAVKDGFLVEAAFPVSRPVETGRVHTRLLEDVHAWTLVHYGSHEKIRDTTSALIEHARAHAGTLAAQREVYLQLDLDDPGQNVTEVQLVKHEWDSLLAEGVERSLGRQARELVMEGIEQIAPESSLEVYAEWIRGAMDALDSLTDGPEVKYQVLSCCAHVFPDERIAHLRSTYERRRDIDDVLQEMYQDPAWYEDPVRKGNVLYMRKVPYDPQGYEQGATQVERRRAYCHCEFVRPYLDQVPSRMSTTFCWCGSGWYRRLWEGILDQPIKIEHVETLLNGNDQCTLTITLPLALEGEMRPERASLELS